MACKPVVKMEQEHPFVNKTLLAGKSLIYSPVNCLNKLAESEITPVDEKGMRPMPRPRC